MLDAHEEKVKLACVCLTCFNMMQQHGETTSPIRMQNLITYSFTLASKWRLKNSRVKVHGKSIIFALLPLHTIAGSSFLLWEQSDFEKIGGYMYVLFRFPLAHMHTQTIITITIITIIIITIHTRTRTHARNARTHNNNNNNNT
jgi:hypothetical protein